MSENPNELTTDNCVVVLIDHQPGVALMTTPLSHNDLINNVAGLAESAKALNVPTVLTTVGASGGPLVDPICKEISAVFPEAGWLFHTQVTGAGAWCLGGWVGQVWWG
ncbi:hypothetical protein ACWEPC_11425 [Nonomuraea sp. NPDC004297]